MINEEIRRIFYNYFQKHNHHKVLSAPIVPAKDPTIMFTNAGMNQFKSVFLQEESRDYKRAVSIQKCMRVSGKHNDFDEVGRSDFHHTFFEMLGNFSFGDYFKEKACQFGWELLTEHYGFKPESLWVTVFKEDDEAFRIWEDKIGVPAKRIVRLGEKDNFWQMGETGPCGPCSELHVDRGPQFGPEEFTDDNKRYVEIWNLVFMQYSRDKSGKLNPLPAPSIDTGMGLERLTTMLQGHQSNYASDLFRPLINYTADIAGIDANDEKFNVGLNVVADHIRALSFLISDGVLPSNTGRGYVLRRILRRAVKHGKSLGFTKPFLHQVSSKVVDMMKSSYPELEYNRNFIAELILVEEEKFDRTLLSGLKRFDEILENTLEAGEKIIPGSELFKLSDTYGFPIDFSRDLAQEKDVSIDFDGFQQEREQQQKLSRQAHEAKQKAYTGLEGIEKYSTEFSGYTSLEEESDVPVIYKDGKPVEQLEEGDEALVVFNRTPFYAESGGQVGDQGTGKNNNAFLEISQTRKAGTAEKGAYLHSVLLKKGTLKTGDTLSLQVDAAKRKETAVHHTATHLLHAALREVLGLHVKQAGSFVGPERLRFDFSHYKAIGRDELATIEELVNKKIRENIPVQTDVLKYEEAIERGAMAIFAEKYSDVVRMLSVSDFSKELCGGTHLAATGEIGFFKITSESSISSGIRRIEAVAGTPGYNYVRNNLEQFHKIHTHFSQKQETIADYLVNMERQFKEREKELKKKSKQQKSSKLDLNTIVDQGTGINGTHTVICLLDSIDRKELSSLADEIKNKTNGIVVLITNLDEKSAIIVSVAKKLNPGVNAGKIVKEISAMLNGRGGGRPDFAQAGGDMVDADKFLNLKPKITDIIKSTLQ